MPDFAKTFAIASALNDHQWSEPYVAEEWRVKADGELQDMIQQEGEADEDEGSSSVYSDYEEDEIADGGKGREKTAADEEEGNMSSPASEGNTGWTEGVVGLI
jgi:hypothetical protein